MFHKQNKKNYKMSKVYSSFYLSPVWKKTPRNKNLLYSVCIVVQGSFGFHSTLAMIPQIQDISVECKYDKSD